MVHNDCQAFFIRGEGLIPRPSGAFLRVLNPIPIPFENNIPPLLCGGVVDLLERIPLRHPIFLRKLLAISIEKFKVTVHYQLILRHYSNAFPH